MKLSDIVDALRAVRDPDTNHGGLLALRRHVSRSRPAADQLLIDLLQISPHLQEIHAIWEIQVSAKDIKTTLELLSCTTALLSYTPSSSCPADHQQQIQQALDAFAGVLIQRRLKPLYFHLSSGAKARSNAALALLTAVAGRGGSVLRELVAAFDFTHSALPKLARPPKTSSAVAAGAAGDEVAAVAAGSSDGPDVPAHWLSWNDLSVSRRPSRALFLEWVAMMLQMSDPLLLPVLLQTRPLMAGLLNHLASDPPGVILSLLQLLNNKVLGGSSSDSSAGVSAATQLELWGDAALNQLALIAAPAAVAAAEGEAAAAVMSRLADLAAAQGSSTGAGRQQYATKEDLQILGLKQGSQQQQQDDLMDTDISDGNDESSGSSEDDDSDSSSSSGSSDSKSDDKPTALQAAAALKQQQQDQRAEALVAAAATAAYDILLMLLTHPTKSLLSGGSSTAAPTAAATFDTTGMSRLEKTLAKSSSSGRSPAAAASGHLRALRLLQRLQPWISAAHARLIKAVAAAHPQLASELLQSGLGSYPLEPKPCLSYLSSVGVVSTLVAAAAAAPSKFQQQCKQGLHLVRDIPGSISAAAAAGSSVFQRVPDVGDAAVRADIRCCLPDAVHKGLLSRGLQHQNPLVVSATLSMIQRGMAAVQQLVTPVRQVAAALAAASSNMHLQQQLQQQQRMQGGSQLLQQHDRHLQQQYDQLLNAQTGGTAAAAAADPAMAAVAAAAAKWSAFSTQLQHAIRFRAPDISVLVALMTSLQRAAAAAAGSSAGKQQQHQYSSDQLVVLQVQVCGVLEVYVQCLPDAVVDGHVDVHKLMLQGQDLLSAHADVQLAALKVLAAAQQQAAAADPVLPDANSMSVAHLLPLLKLAAASPAAAVREMARALLADRMQLFCGSSGSSGIEVGIWLQRLPQIWSPLTLDSNIANGDQAAAGAQSSLVTSNMLELEWVCAQLAVLNFVSEAIVAVARKPQEPWETIQQTLQSINAAASSSSSSRGSATMASPSLFAVCSFRKMLKLLKSQKAAAAVKAAVCGYVCCVWQQLLLQCVNEAPLRLLLLEQLMREEGEEWVAAATAAAGSSNMATAAASSQPINGSSNKKKRKLEQQQGTAAAPEPQQQQQLLLPLPVEAAAIVSLHQCCVSLCMTCESGNKPIMHTSAASNSTTKRRKSNSEHSPTAAAANHKQPNLHQHLELLLPSKQKKQQRQLEDKASAVRQAMLAAAVLLDPDGSSSSSVRESTIAAAPEVIVQQWQQLELLLLMSSTAAVRNVLLGVFTAAHIAAAALDQIIADSPAAATAAAAAAAKAAVAYVVQQIPTVLQAHGLTFAELLTSSNSGGTNNHSKIAAIAVTSAPSPAAAAATLISLCSSSHSSSGSSSDSNNMLLLCDCLIQASLGHDLRAAAAAAGEGHTLADDPEWRSVVLSLLLPGPQQQQQQQLTLSDKQQLASLICCSMARTAASAALANEVLNTRLAFAVQLLQSLMLSAGSSSSSARVMIDMDVVTAVLSHPVFEQLYLDSSSSSSAVLTKHIVLLLVWLLTSAAPPAPAAAAAAAPAPVEQQQSILQACTSYVSKALTVVQQHITGLQQGRTDHGGSSSSLVSQPEVDLAVAVSLELLPCIRSISSSGSSQAVTQIIGQLEQLAALLLAAHAQSSSSKQGAQAAAGRSQRTDRGLQQQQQQQVKGPAAAAAVVASPAWLQQLLLVVAELLITHQQQQQQQWGRPQQQPMQPANKSNLQADLWAFVLEQFASHPSDDVDACVAAALGAATSAAAPSAAAAAALSNVTSQHDRPQNTEVATDLQQTAATPRVLQSCLQHPLNPTRVAVAAQIMILNPTNEIIQCFAAAVSPCSHAAAAAGTANAADAGAGARREAIALLLPAVEAYLGAKLQIDAAAAEIETNGSLAAAAAVPAEDVVVDMFKSALLAYMQRKRRKPQQQQQISGSSSSSSLSAAAVQSLQQHALPMLQKCLLVAPLDSSSREKLLLKLLPAAGYTAAAAANAKSVEAVATHKQQLQLAAWLVQQQQQQQPQEGAAAIVQASAQDSSPATLQQQQQQLQEVSLFVTCACSSLALLFKHSPWQQQQQQGLEISRSSLEQSLLDQLNGWAGDLLADIPDIFRSSSSSSSNDSSDHSDLITALDKVGRSAFAAVVAAVRRLSVPVLQYRFGDSEAVRCLRRLLAALLPGSLAMSDVVEADVVHHHHHHQQQQQQQHDLEPETDDQVIEDTSDDHEQASDAEELAQQHNGHHESMQPPLSDNSGSSSSDGDSTSTSGDSGTVSSGAEGGVGMDVGIAAGSSDGSSSESEGEVSSSSSSDDSVSDHLDLGATTSEQQRSDSDSLDPAAAVAAAVYNPEAAAAASDLLQLLVSHSAFIPALLLPDQQQPLPAAVAAVARPMFSYMPVVDAVWASEAAVAAHDTHRSGSAAFKHQLVLLLEVLLDMTRLFTDQPQQQQPGSADADSDNSASLGGSIDQSLLQSLLQLLQVARCGTLSDCDRAIFRVLLLLDKLVPQQQQQQTSDDLDPAQGHLQEAAAGSVSFPLAWPRCLFGTAAKLYYEQQRKQVSAAAPTAAEFLQTLLRSTSPLDPLRCALTVVCYPDRRCLNPEAEPNGGNDLSDLYHILAAGSSPLAAAAAYDPASLLLLGFNVLQHGLLDVEGFAECGLLGVVLRSLAAEDDDIRSLAYSCFRLLRKAVQQYLPETYNSSSPQSHKTTMQQLLKSSKHAHQITALLLFVAAANSTEQQQQIPAAAAVLAAECALLLAAPAAAMHMTVHKLLLRQQALDTNGLQLFSRIMSTAAAGGGVRGAAGVMAEKQWLMRLLWLGLRGPLDGRLYRRKYVCETLMTLAGSAAGNYLAAAAAGSSSAEYDAGYMSFGLQIQSTGLRYPSSSSSSSSSLDGAVSQVMRQAVGLPGLASHLIRSAGLLPWLAAAAATHIRAATYDSHVSEQLQPSAAATQMAHGETEISVYHLNPPGGSWALGCMLQLLSARVALNKREQAGHVFNAYCAAASSVLAAALTVAGAAAAGPPAVLRMQLPMGMLWQLIGLLLLVIEAAPTAKHRRQFLQMQLHGGALQQLQLLVAAACSTNANRQQCRVDSFCLTMWKQLLAAIVM